MKGYYRQVVRILHDYGYRLLPSRGKGSHEVWSNGVRNQTVPRHLDSRDHANRILRQAGISQRIV